MLSSAVVLLAILGLASAASPAQATYCSEDNLLRAFQHTPTPASKFCVTDTGYPTFLAVTSYPATRLSSACSCFSRFPSEPTAPQPTAACYRYSATGTYTNIVVDITIMIDLTSTTCPTGGFKVTSVCGTFDMGAVVFSPSSNYGNPNYCLYPSGTTFVDNFGLNFEYGNSFVIADMYYANGYTITKSDDHGSDTYDGTFQAVTCGPKCPAP